MKPVAPQSILLVKTSSLGDVIHNLPVASDLRRRFPQAAIDWVVEEGFAEIPRMHSAVRRVIPVATRRWRKALFSPQTWREIAEFRFDLQAVAYDVVLDTQGLLKSALLVRTAHLASGGRRCGYAAEAIREPLAARFYDAGYGIPKNLHAIERNRGLAAAAFEYLPDLPLDYGIQAQPLIADWLPQSSDSTRLPYAVLLTATSRADKRWPDADWLKLAAELAARGLCCVLPAGSDTERSSAMQLAAGMARATVAPPLSIAELGRLCAGACLVVGVDTGLTHLAAALGRPTLALFCASDPNLTGVYADAAAATCKICNLGSAKAPPDAAAAIASITGLLE